ncbi:respiratory nitrate reductase subunit gamma [Kibdelosporangium aridum]|uniref:Nitrate reductase-like protein NarX n=1 Tax=Kibdelosporangium aridum TaxID=2030 RepID=A0A428ZDD4_KIBAR|nr:respiratory nitrate reductase subunit gamma [Kibdelosporangium aridum]RSM86061.1 respiratory nitrate reductase subunit gamma [Kibdelosporangium aridum]
MNTALWVVLPYIALTTFVLGHLWRYRTDKFGWTARSGQLHEQRLLRWGSPLFHYGILVTALGHAAGLLVPAGVTEALGVPVTLYKLAAFVLGGVAGIAALAGLAILIYRRLTVRAVARSRVFGDTVMYTLLTSTMLLGLGITLFGGGHEYRETVAPWFRSIFVLQPDTDAIADAPFWFKVHALSAWMLIACWPFTRLVHAFSLPLGYFTRPYILYRGREGSRRA